ncbi:MAG: lytic transglycosylase domain-containing protein [Nitrososphaerota archaeon]|nr:lytic transglycosylase domain-containing protein [Nitrososphaerota archaeon]
MAGLPFQDEIKQAAADYPDVPAALIMAVIETESSFNPKAFLSDRNGGSYGLMQLNYPTAKEMGLSSADDASALYDPQTNIWIGTAYLNHLYHEFKDWKKAIMAYNEGPGNVLKGLLDDVYYAKVYARWQKWKAIL